MENAKYYTQFEFERIYHKIKRIITRGKEKMPLTIMPTATLIGGQPGAGKTTLTEILLKNDRNVVIVDGDMIRTWHPSFDFLQKMHGMDYPRYTQIFVNEAVERLINELSSERYNLVIEGTLRDINVPIGTATKLRQKGYKVNLMVIATAKDCSWESTIKRGDMMAEYGLIPRYVEKSHHDKVVKSLPGTVLHLSHSKLFSRVMIIDREKRVLFDSQLSTDENIASLMNRCLLGCREEEIKKPGIFDKFLQKEKKSSKSMLLKKRNGLQIFTL